MASRGEKKTLDSLYKQFLKSEYIKTPKEFQKGDSINEYLRNIDDYCKALGIEGEDYAYVLLNNLDDDVKFEIFGLSDYLENSLNSDWIIEQLKELNGYTTTCITPLIELLKCRQQSGENIKQFASNLRVKAFKIMGHNDVSKREEYLVSAFIKGIQNRSLAQAIKSLNPQTLSEALQLARKEKEHNGENEYEVRVRAVQVASEGQLEELRREITSLKEKMNYLISLVSKQASGNNGQFHANAEYKRRLPKYNGPTLQNGKTALKCYNCNVSNHIAKHCKQPCSVCKSPHHSSYYCEERKKHVRSFQLEKDEENADDSISQINSTHSSLEIEDMQVVTEEAISYNTREWTTVNRQKRRSNPKKNYVSRNKKNVNNWIQYINGHGNKPKKNLLIRELRLQRAGPNVLEISQ